MCDALLACPVCHGDLPLAEIRRCGAGICRQCGRRFTYGERTFNLIPYPPPHRGVRRKWETWQQLQENGLVSYTEDPANNLSVPGRQDVAAFAAFCRPAGLVLDIGCGPQSLPAYWTSPEDGELIGIDPLPGVGDREFHFIQGIGEYLPFRSGSFDQILLASALDHALSPRGVLREAKRVLKQTGRLSLWVFDVQAGERTAGERRQRRRAAARLRIRKLAAGLRLLVRGDLAGIRARMETISAARKASAAAPDVPAYVSTLHVPKGAVDLFHFHYYRRRQVLRWLGRAGFAVSRTHEFGRVNVFIEARPLAKLGIMRWVGLSLDDRRARGRETMK